MDANEAREQLASLCHEQWSGWMRYLFSKGTFNKDGTWTMPKWAVDRWTRQTLVPYSKLSASEQESDRKEADKFLKILNESQDINILSPDEIDSLVDGIDDK